MQPPRRLLYIRAIKSGGEVFTCTVHVREPPYFAEWIYRCNGIHSQPSKEYPPSETTIVVVLSEPLSENASYSHSGVRIAVISTNLILKISAIVVWHVHCYCALLWLLDTLYSVSGLELLGELIWRLLTRFVGAQYRQIEVESTEVMSHNQVNGLEAAVELYTSTPPITNKRGRSRYYITHQWDAALTNCVFLSNLRFLALLAYHGHQNWRVANYVKSCATNHGGETLGECQAS